MMGMWNCHHVSSWAQYTQELFPSLSKLAVISLKSMSTVDCEGGLSALLCIKIDASKQLLSKILNCLMMIFIEEPLTDDFNFDEVCQIKLSLYIYYE